MVLLKQFDVFGLVFEVVRVDLFDDGEFASVLVGGQRNLIGVRCRLCSVQNERPLEKVTGSRLLALLLVGHGLILLFGQWCVGVVFVVEPNFQSPRSLGTFGPRMCGHEWPLVEAFARIIVQRTTAENQRSRQKRRMSGMVLPIEAEDVFHSHD